MSVDRRQLQPGNGIDTPQAGDIVTIEYTGWLYDASVPDNKGQQFDSRADFKTAIGVGRVIQGWDMGILSGRDGPMTLGGKATLDIASDRAYGAHGYPGKIPPNARLIFDIELKAINDKKA